MKTLNKKTAPWAIAAICLGLSNAVWADDMNSPSSSSGAQSAGRDSDSGSQQMMNNQSSAGAQSATENTNYQGSAGYQQNSASSRSAIENTAASTADQPTAANRASGVVGMDVRNQNGEHLGHIKDIVFDLNSERVSYAVLTTAPKGLPFVNEKLLAVPLNAFTPGPDNKYLILRADKSQIETASGIQNNNWPSVNNPSWGAQPFWQNNNQGGTVDQNQNKQNQ
jgi:sporulation protein YlmC with PRC-barrel domain